MNEKDESVRCVDSGIPDTTVSSEGDTHPSSETNCRGLEESDVSVDVGSVEDSPMKGNFSGVNCDVNWRKFMVAPEDMKKMKRGVREFYRTQNKTISDILSYENSLSRSRQTLAWQDELSGAASAANRGIMISFFSNVFLLFVKITALIFTPSLLMITTVVDSALDITSGLVIFLTAVVTKKKSADVYRYPVGAQRMEPLGTIVFCCIMASASFQIIQQAFMRIIQGEPSPPLELISLFLIMLTVIIKIVLYYYCSWILRSVSSQSLSAMTQDHRNDIAMNTVIAAAIFTTKYIWWLDAVCAALLALYIMRNWAAVCVENIRNLAGGVADKHFLKLITYIAAHHSTAVTNLETVRAYRMGNFYWVEVDLVLPPLAPLEDAHDIGEKLQNHIEQLPDVERAFVHVDYDCVHKPEHS